MQKNKIAKVIKESHSRKQMVYDALIKKRHYVNGGEYTYQQRMMLSGKQLQYFMKCGDVIIFNKFGEYIRGQSCGLKDICLKCASRNSSLITKEIMNALPNSYIKKMNRYMLTLTIQHNSYSQLGMLLELLISAKKKLNEGVRDARKNKNPKSFFSQFSGMVRALETTKGDNGFHPHFHVLACSKRKIDIAICAGNGPDIDSNRNGIRERNKVLKEVLNNMIDAVPGDDVKDIKNSLENYLGSTFTKEELIDDFLSPLFSDTKKGLHIKKLSTKAILDNPYSRHSLGEVFKYTTKMADMEVDDILEYASIIRERGYQTLTKTGVFTGKERKQLMAQKLREDNANGASFQSKEKGTIIMKRVPGKSKFETVWSNKK